MHGPRVRSFYSLTYKYLSSEDTLIQLGRAVSHLSVSKDSLGWDLVTLEHRVQTTNEGQLDSDDENPPALL
jgi:hypothetical protein